MLNFIMGSTVFVKTILACSAFGIISFIVLSFSYRSMIKATGHIGKTRKKWLVSLKKKYIDYHEMNVKVNNTETFVDSAFRKKRICGLSAAFWRTLLQLTVAACAITGAAGALSISQSGGDLTDVILTYLTGVTAASVLLFLNIFLRAEEKERRIRMNMNDYLDNVLENSIAGRDGEEESLTSREQRRRLTRYARENNGYKGRKAKAKDEPVSMEEKKLLEDVLQEFFA